MRGIPNVSELKRCQKLDFSLPIHPEGPFASNLVRKRQIVPPTDWLRAVSGLNFANSWRNSSSLLPLAHQRASWLLNPIAADLYCIVPRLLSRESGLISGTSRENQQQTTRGKEKMLYPGGETNVRYSGLALFRKQTSSVTLNDPGREDGIVVPFFSSSPPQSYYREQIRITNVFPSKS